MTDFFSHRFLKSLAGVFLCAGAMFAHAGVLDDFQQSRKEGKTTTMLAIDNDTLLLNRRDGFYTSGVRIGQQYAMPAAGQTTVFGWQIGQELYTASDIKLPAESVGPPDHPYAAWLHGGFFRETRHDDGSHTRIGFDIGCLGPCAGGEWTQRNLHRLLRQPQPQGWNSQVRNEAGVVIYAEIAPVRWEPSPSFDLAPVLHGRFGNIHTDAGAGIKLRAGQLRALQDQSALYGFIRLDGSRVAYDATLQGGYFSSDNSHTVKPKQFVGEAEAGMVWNNGPYQVSASIVRRGNEIKALPDSIGAQNFARLLFSYTP